MNTDQRVKWCHEEARRSDREAARRAPDDLMPLSAWMGKSLRRLGRRTGKRGADAAAGEGA